MVSEMRFGVTYPAGLQASCALERYAREVEAMGCDSMWLIENLGTGTPGFECLTTLGYMAAATRSTRGGLRGPTGLRPLPS